MVTPADSLSWSKSRWRTPSGPYATPNHALSSSYLKQEFLLHDWWLIKVDSDGQSKRLGVGGFTCRENQGTRCFSSAPIVKRCDAVTLTSADGTKIMVHGHLNRSRTLENGFTHEVCDHFVIGFPYYWEEFAGVSVDKRPKPANSPAVSDGRKMRAAIRFCDIQGVSEGDKEPKPANSPAVSDGRKMRAAVRFCDIQGVSEGDKPSIAKKGSSWATSVVSSQDKPLFYPEEVKGKRKFEAVGFSGRLTRSKARVLKWQVLQSPMNKIG